MLKPWSSRRDSIEDLSKTQGEVRNNDSVAGPAVASERSWYVPVSGKTQVLVMIDASAVTQRSWLQFLLMPWSVWVDD